METMEEKLVTIKVTSLDGHSEFTLTAPEAIEKIKSLYNDEKKWVYIDGSVVHPNRITQEMLLGARNILASGAVVGGYLFSSGPEYNDVDDDNVVEEVTVEDAPEELEEFGEETLADDNEYPGEVNGMMADELVVDVDLKFEDMIGEGGDTTVKGSPNGKFVVAFEVQPATGDKPAAINVWIDKKEIATVAHLRNFMFIGGHELLEGYLQGELDKFKQVYNIE